MCVYIERYTYIYGLLLPRVYMISINPCRFIDTDSNL